MIRLKAIGTAAVVAVGFATLLGSGGGAVAFAQQVPPPTLSGESFHQDIPTITSVTCTQTELGFTFEASGTATGPYPGTFQETGSARTLSDQSGHVLSYDLTMAFTIDSPVGRVTGTKHSASFGLSCGVPTTCTGAACELAGVAFNTDPSGFAFTDTYQARISTADGTFADDGLFSAVLYHSDSPPSSLDGFDESFQSMLGAPVPLTPTMVDQCKRGGWQEFGFKNQGQCVAFVERGPGPQGTSGPG